MCELACPIGMYRAKCADCQSIPHNRTDDSVAAIFFVAQSVAVLDLRSPSTKLTCPRADVILDSDVVAQNVTAPAVVIPCDPENLESVVAQLGKCAECAEACARNHGFPLEPEIEEITVDYERACSSAQIMQEANKSALDVARRNADVRIGNEITW